jgi:hypothetical protein
MLVATLCSNPVYGIDVYSRFLMANNSIANPHNAPNSGVHPSAAFRAGKSRTVREFLAIYENVLREDTYIFTFQKQ